MKKVFVHPPEFFPPLDFFFGLLNSDIWVILDHLQFTTRSRQSRCRLKTDMGVVQIPVTVTRPCSKPLFDMVINNGYPWRRIFLRKIKEHYSEAPFFEEYFEAIHCFVESPYVLLEQLSVESTLWVAKLLGKEVNCIRSRDIVANIGVPAAVMIPQVLEKTKGILFDEIFKHPYYPQQREPFERDCSIIDSLFCIGADAVAEKISLKTL
jgi:hypothetical protein